MDVRHFLAGSVVVGVAAMLAFDPGPAVPGGSGSFLVFVMGPTSLLSSGNVTLLDADALEALLVFTAQVGVEVSWDDRPGCSYDYVRGIGPYQETRSGGWNFYVDAGAGWVPGSQSASCTPLQAGDVLLWCWVENDGDCAVWP